jgi:hypothetical protein
MSTHHSRVSAPKVPDIREIRRGVTIHALALSFGVPLRQNGIEWLACCPFHDEATPSFTIYRGFDGIERFKCFGCDEGGDVIDFVERIKGVSTPEALRILAADLAGGIVTPHEGTPLIPMPELYSSSPVTKFQSAAPFRSTTPNVIVTGRSPPQWSFRTGALIARSRDTC